VSTLGGAAHRPVICRLRHRQDADHEPDKRDDRRRRCGHDEVTARDGCPIVDQGKGRDRDDDPSALSPPTALYFVLHKAR
jgi:hypothetical protein